MAYTRFNTDVENVSHLSDLPNEEDGLSAAALKAVFDKAGVDIKDFINNTLIPELSASDGKSFTVTFPAGETTYTYSTTSYGITSATDVFCQPATASRSQWTNSNIKCSAVGNGSLTFTAATAPSADVAINVFVMN